MIGFIRKVLNHFGFARDVAKPPDPLLERWDKVVEPIDTLRVQVVTKEDRQRKARMDALDLQALAQRRR